MKITVWEISGYKGKNDYDGPQDDNFGFEVLMDSRFSKEDVEEIFFNKYSKKYRSVALKAIKRNEIEVLA